jgi:ABC-2 type transport system permease protein
MRKLWLVAKQEFQKRVKKKSFIIGTLLFPVLFGIIIGVTIFIIERDKNTNPIGYVDHSGILKAGLLPENSTNDTVIKIIEFTSQKEAMLAIENLEIQAFFVVPADYLISKRVDLYYWRDYPDQSTIRVFNDYIRMNLLPDGPGIIQSRIIEGIDLTMRSGDGKRQFDEDTGFVAILFPMAVAMFFIFAVIGASGYFLQAITDEKENRTMEIAITSLAPWQLIGGKSLGLIAVAFSQIIIWLTSILIALGNLPKLYPELMGLELPLDILLVFLLFFIPAFVLVGSMMVAIGGAVTELQEGQQIAGILNLLFTFPLFLTAFAIANPNSPLLIFLSFWPTTSFLTITLRWGLTIIPFWQIIVSWFILVLSSVITIYFAINIFRIGMLRYGKRLSLKAVFIAIRSLDSRQPDM